MPYFQFIFSIFHCLRLAAIATFSISQTVSGISLIISFGQANCLGSPGTSIKPVLD